MALFKADITEDQLISHREHPPQLPPTPATTSVLQASPKPPFHSFWALRAFLCCSITWSAVMTGCLGPFFPLYMKENFQASTTLVGFIFSVTSLVQFLTCPLVAHISHRITRLGSLRLAILILIGGGFIFGLSHHAAGFLAGRLLQGMGNGVLEVAGLSLLMRHSPDIRRDIGLLEGSWALGFLFGPLLGGLIFHWWGIRTLFLLLTAPFLLFLSLLLLCPHWIVPRTSSFRIPPPSSTHASPAYPTGAGCREDEASDLPPPRLTPASFLPGMPDDQGGARAYLHALFQALGQNFLLPVYIVTVLLVSGALG